MLLTQRYIIPRIRPVANLPAHHSKAKFVGADLTQRTAQQKLSGLNKITRLYFHFSLTPWYWFTEIS
jgi:hypothetical protein